MKKLVLLLAVVCSVSLFSCGGNSDAEKAAEDTVATDTVAAVQEETVVEDTCANCENADTCTKCNEEAKA